MKFAILAFSWAVITFVSTARSNRSESIKPTNSSKNTRKLDVPISIITPGDASGKPSNVTSSVGRTAGINRKLPRVSNSSEILADAQSFDSNVMKSSSLRSSTQNKDTLPLKPRSMQKLQQEDKSQLTSGEKRKSKWALQGKRTTKRALQKKNAARRALRKSKEHEQTLQKKRTSRRSLRKKRIPKRALRDKRMSKKILQKRRAFMRSRQKKRISKPTVQTKRTLRKRHTVDTPPLQKHSPSKVSTGARLVHGNVSKPESVFSKVAGHTVKAVMSTLKPNVRTKHTKESGPSAESVSKSVVQTRSIKESKKATVKPRTLKRKRSPRRGKTHPPKRPIPKANSSTRPTPSPCKRKSKVRRRKNPLRKPHPPMTSIRVNGKCFCRLVTAVSKRCYVFTNEAEGKCRSRQCPPEWRCVKAGITKNLCIPEVKTENIELIPGSRTLCRGISHPVSISWVFYKRLKILGD